MLTPAQKATLKAAILADSVLNAFPNTTDGNLDMASGGLTALVSPTFFVYATAIPVQSVYDQVVWANLTPTDAPDTTQQWANRSLACQGKQFNLQTILIGAQGSLNGAKANIRAGLQDALTNVPSGVSGALVSAGWNPVRDNVLARPANKLEKIFATVTVQNDGSTAAKAATMVIEGVISGQDVADARNS